ncbi:uncharacterized protein METZ01_LOCUS378913, partial [marine metagenome]
MYAYDGAFPTVHDVGDEGGPPAGLGVP